MLAQPLERGDDLVQLGAGGAGQRLGAHRVGAQEEQRLDGRLERRLMRSALSGAAIAPFARPACRGSIVISANGSSWVQVSSPCL